MSGLAICVADSDLDLRSFADPNVSREALTYCRQNDRVLHTQDDRAGNGETREFHSYPAFKSDDDDNDDSDLALNLA